MADTNQAGAAATYDDHDKAVMDRINGIISKVNEQHPGSTVAEKLEFAWAENIRMREDDPTDTVGRDADYYFAARHVIADDKSLYLKYFHAGVGEVAWSVYSLLKLGTELIGKPEVMRADPDKPNAPVGGFFWMNRGAADAFRDRGQDNTDVILHLPDQSPPKQPAPNRPPLKPFLSS